MFIYGVCAGASDKYERIVEPSILRINAEAHVMVERGRTSIHEAYNAMISRAATFPDVEGLILVHDDVELKDSNMEQSLRNILADNTVGVVGVIGGSNHSAMPWWEGSVKAGRVIDNQQGEIDFGKAVREVDTVDGLLLVLSPTALGLLKFDERRYPRSFHGYDADICSQARAAGLKVAVADVEVRHHNNAADWRGDALDYAIIDLTWQLKWRKSSFAKVLLMHGTRMRYKLRRWRRDRHRAEP